MKKLIPLMLAIAILLCSCSLLTPPQTSSFSFTLDKDFADNLARSVADAEGIENEELTITVELTGGVSETKTVKTTLAALKKGNFKINFSSIPLNKKFVSTVKVYLFGDDLIFEGTSVETVLKEKPAPVDVTIDEKTEIEYAIYQTAGRNKKSIGIFKPYEVLNATQEDFIKKEHDSYESFDHIEFDANGDLWVIKKAQVGEAYLPTLHKRIKKNDDTYEFVPIQLGFIVKKFTIDNKTNKLFAFMDYYPSEQERALKVFSYTINPNATGSTNLLNNKPDEGNNLIPDAEYNLTQILEDSKSYTKNEEHTFDYGYFFDWNTIKVQNDIMYFSFVVEEDSEERTDISHQYIVGYNFAKDDFIGCFNSDTVSSINNKNLELSDMLIQDGYIYALLANYYSPNIDFNYDDEVFVVNSYGAVLKLNPRTLALEKIIGLTEFTEDRDQPFIPYYSDTDYEFYTDNSAKEKVILNYSIYYNAPKDKNAKVLFAPTRFIAIKPKKLVFTDRGYIVYKSDDDWFYAPVSRMVTVDLESFAITDTKELNIDFTVPSSGYSNATGGKILNSVWAIGSDYASTFACWVDIYIKPAVKN